MGSEAITLESTPLVNWAAYADARSTLGADFIRILGYFNEDGSKSVDAIEAAMRRSDATGMVIPAHTLKGESYQFGAERLALVAEQIEMTARRCIEHHEAPDELLATVVKLRTIFVESLQLLENEANPLVQRRNFGRKSAEDSNQSFGRI